MDDSHWWAFHTSNENILLWHSTSIGVIVPPFSFFPIGTIDTLILQTEQLEIQDE
jgi:hypothetical protein